MSLKLYARFIADLEIRGRCEYGGIIELNGKDRETTSPNLLGRLIARELSLDAESVQVTHWSRLH
jgi:hypothetical protein